MATERFYLRDTQTNTGAGGTGRGAVYDLLDATGTAATIAGNTDNNTTYVLLYSFTATLGTTVTGTSFPTSYEVTSIANTPGFYINVARYNSAGTFQARSANGTVRTATGTFTETLTLTTTWATGDQLRIEVWGNRNAGHSASTVTLGVNRTTSYVDADITAAAVTGQAALDGAGTLAGTGVTESLATAALDGAGLLAGTASEPSPDTIDVYAQIFASDGTTALTDRVLVATWSTLTASYATITGAFTITGTPTKADWDGARAKLEWVYTTNGGAAAAVRVTAVDAPGTYEAAVGATGAAAMSGAGTLAGTGITKAVGQAAVTGAGGVSGAGLVKALAQAAVDGAGLIVAAALTFALALAACSGEGVLYGAGQTTQMGHADLAGSGDIAGAGLAEAFGAAALDGEGLLGATGDPYVPVVSVDAPDAWWRFTETSGTAAADEVGTNDLTVTGANLNVTGATHTGSAISFDGTDDKAVSGSSLGWTGAHSLTVEAWLKVSSWVTPTVTPDSVFLLWINTSGNLAFQVRDVGKTTWAVASATAPSTGAWHHAVGVWDRTAKKALLYLNGTLVNSSAEQTFTDIGALSEIVQVATDGGTVFTAVEMDELAIYNEALSSTRIAAHYEAGSGLSLNPTGEADLAGEGDVAGAGLVEAFGASALDGSGDVAGSAFTESFAAAALSGEGNLVGASSAIFVGEAALAGAGTLDGSAVTTALDASALDGAGVLTADATTTALGGSVLDGEGAISADGEAVAVAASTLNGSGVVAGSGTTESFGTVALDGAGNLYGNAGDVQSGEGALVGEGLLVGDGLTLSYAEAAISGEGVVGASGLAIGLGVADLNGSGDIAATGEAESFAAAGLTGEGDLYGASSTGPVQGAANLDGSSSVVADAIATAYGAIVCNLPVVTFNSEEVQFGADLITFGGTTCRYIYGVGDLAATPVAIEGAYGSMVGEGNLTASGTTTAFGAAGLAGEGRLQGAQVGAATPCYISLESGDNVLLEDGHKLKSEVPSCSTGTAALSGSGEIAGLGYLVFYGTVAFDGSGLIDATSLDIVQGTSAINGSGDIAADGETLSIAAASLSGEGHLYAASQGHGVGVAALAGEGIISGDLIQQATRCTISLETGFTVRLEDASRLLAEPDSCAKAAVTGEGLLDGAGRAVAYAEAALAGQGRFGAYGEDSSWGSAALTGEGRFGAYGGDNHLGLINFTGEGILNRCNAILAEDGDGILFEDAGRIVTVCLARPITVYFVSADLVGEGILDAYAKDTGVLYYFLKRNLMLEGRLYYFIGGNWVFGELEEI